MKASGVPELGDIPSHWRVPQLGQIGRLFKGSGGTKEDEATEGVACVRYGDLYTQHKGFITHTKTFIPEERANDYTEIRRGDILFAASGETIDEIGKSAVNLLDGPARCGGDIIVWRPAVECDAWFMGYAMASRPAVLQKSRSGRGITVMHIYADDLKYVRIPLPPVREQAAIARFLAYVERKVQRYIRDKQRLVRLLEDQRQAIVDRAVRQGLDGDVGLAPSGVKWIGYVPNHWSVLRLRNVISEQTRNGLYRAQDHYAPDGTPIVQMGEAFSSRVLTRVARDRVRVSPRDTETWLLREGDLLFARRSVVFEGSGKCSLVGRLPEPHVFESSLIRVRIDESQMLPEFAFRYFTSTAARAQILAETKQVTISGIDSRILKDIRILLPPIEEQEAIIKHIRDKSRLIDTAIKRTQDSLQAILEFRARMVADAVAGKVDVSDVTAQLSGKSEGPGPLGEECYFHGSEDRATDEEMLIEQTDDERH